MALSPVVVEEQTYQTRSRCRVSVSPEKRLRSYYRARYYDPAAGRYLSEDPSSFFSGSIDFYDYVENSPVEFNDPNGLQARPTSSCCGQDKQKIKQGLQQLQQAFNGTKAAHSAIFQKYKNCLLKQLHDPHITCGPQPKGEPTECGSHNPASPGVIVLTPNGLSGGHGCGPVKTTIAHEFVHVCYQDDLNGPALNEIDQEKEAYGLECQLFGVNCAGARNPKKCGY